MAKKVRHSYEYVQKIFKDKGCVLLSTEYKDMKSHLNYVCKCGNDASKSLGSFIRNTMCGECVKKHKNFRSRKHSIEHVREVFSNNGCVLLENHYVNSKTKMKCICICGEVKFLRYEDVAKGSHCRECSYKKTAESLCKYTLDDARKIFEESECVLLSDTYKTTSDILKYKCTCGNESEIRFYAFLSGARCKKCAVEKQIGENNWQWKHDKTDEERLKGRKFRDYELWRRRVFERDKYTCDCCGQYGGGLAAHHLDGWHWCIEKRLEASNGITLCNECHGAFHAEYGKRDNTKEQYAIWIKNNKRLCKDAI